MAYPIYYVPDGDTLPIMFDTFDGGTGASITMTGLAVTDIEIYKDGSVTQRASDAGYTLLDTDGIDFDGITGIHGFSIDLSDNTDAGFYTVGSWYHVVVSTITIDAQTVSFIAAAFRIMAAEDAAGVPDVNVTHFGGTAGTFASGRPEVNTTHVGGTAQTANDIGQDVNDILTDTADMQPKLGTISDLGGGATIGANLSDIEAQTDDIGVAGAGLTAIPWNNAAWDAEVESEVTDALNAYDPPTRAELTSDTNSILAQLPSDAPVEGTADSGGTTTMVDAARTEADTDYWKGSFIKFTSGNISGQVRLITGFTPASDTITFTPATTQAVATNTYRIIPAAQIEEVLALTGHTAQTGDNFARLGAPAGASIAADIAENQTDLDTIITDTNELQTDWADGGRLDLILDARASQTSVDNLNDPTAASIADAVWDEAKAGHVGAGSFGEEVQAHALSSEVSGLNDPTAASIADAVWDEVITGAEHNVNTSAAKYLREAALSISLLTGTAQSGGASTIVLAAGAVTADDILNGERISIIEGTGAGQSRLISDSVASSDTVTVGHAWTTTPDATSVYTVTGAEADLRAIAEQPVAATGTVDFDDLATILTDTNELQGDWTDGGRLDLIIDAILADTGELQTDWVDGGRLDLILDARASQASVDALNDLSAAQVNAEVLDVLSTDTFAEPTGVPGATVTLATKIGFLYMALRNKVTVTSTKKTFYDDGDAAEWEQDLSDDGTTFTQSEANAI